MTSQPCARQFRKPWIRYDPAANRARRVRRRKFSACVDKGSVAGGYTVQVRGTLLSSQGAPTRCGLVLWREACRIVRWLGHEAGEAGDRGWAAFLSRAAVMNR